MNCTLTPNCGTYYLHGVREFYAYEPRVFFRRARAAMQGLSRENGKNWNIPGIVLFSAAKAHGRKIRTYGDDLATYIRKHRLGTVSAGGWIRNPNTGLDIRVWAWNVNATELNRQ